MEAFPKPMKYIVLIRITMSAVCLFVRINAVIFEIIKSRILGLNMQILEICAQLKFISGGCHAQSNAHKRL